MAAVTSPTPTMDPDGDASRVQNGLEMEQDADGGDRGNGVVELQPLVSSGRYNDDHASILRPRDAPEDDVDISATTTGKVAYNKTHAAAAAANGTSPAIEHVASALSNEGIKQSFQTLFVFGQQAYAAAQDRVSSYRNNNGAHSTSTATANSSNGTSSTAPSSAPPTPTTDYSDAAASEASTKQKKMMLLLLITLFVALMGAALGKYTALEVEEELEEGETEVVIHEDVEAAEAKNEAVAAAEKPKIHIINVEGYQPTEMVNVSHYILPGTEHFPALCNRKR